MKNILYILCLHSLCCSFLYANIPQKIYSITRQNLSTEYYYQQAQLWKKELETNAQNQDAWFNYFMAHHVLFEKGKLDQSTYTSIIKQLQKAIPGSFEAHFAQYKLEKDIQSLFKAYHLAPNRYETYADLISHYEQQQNRLKVTELCQKWLQSGEYSSGMLHWNYNALIGLDQDAILITEGDNHTYPLWLLQHGKNIRPDVHVLNLNLLTQATYRKLICQGLNIPYLESNIKPDIVNHFIHHLNQEHLYISVSVPKGLVKAHEEELYIIGLAFRHTNSNFDNIAALVDNYEHKFLLDYLKQDLLNDVSHELVAQSNINYLPSFLLLHDYYQENEEWAKANAIKTLSLQIADAAQKGDALRAYLNNSFNSSHSKPLIEISHQEIENYFTSLDYNLNLYAGVTEVTNEMYEAFLTDLLKRKEFDQLQAHKIYSCDWKSFLPAKYQHLSDDQLFTNGAPNDEDTPIQNIKYESALAFCEWLTVVYNNIDHKRKKFKRVRFRLPTEKEWMLAVSTQSQYASPNSLFKDFVYKYPWKGSMATNQKGCFLGNFNNNHKDPCKDCSTATYTGADGAFFTTIVDAYFPNSYGLYNTVGNVAEMVQEKGIAKGGSWFHPSEDCTIQGVQTYTEPQPYIGFRVFMEVLEENNYSPIRRGMMGPPGTLHLQGKLYMDETEVSNIDWQEYLYWLQKNAPDLYTAALPDTNVWDLIKDSAKVYNNIYHKHASYANYPSVGISHEQAQNYCQWRSRVVNEMLLLNPNLHKKFGKVLYRLPTEQEWEYAANGGLSPKDYPYGFEEINSKGALKFNVDNPHQQNPLAQLTTTAPSYSYYANAKGYFNMIGNVAEMVQEKGIAKGGSWIHPKEQSKISHKIPYKAPHAWLGFRCICETNL